VHGACVGPTPRGPIAAGGGGGHALSAEVECVMDGAAAVVLRRYDATMYP